MSTWKKPHGFAVLRSEVDKAEQFLSKFPDECLDIFETKKGFIFTTFAPYNTKEFTQCQKEFLDEIGITCLVGKDVNNRFQTANGDKALSEAGAYTPFDSFAYCENGMLISEKIDKIKINHKYSNSIYKLEETELPMNKLRTIKWGKFKKLVLKIE
jgi:hypothetical protein